MLYGILCRISGTYKVPQLFLGGKGGITTNHKVPKKNYYYHSLSQVQH